jgi:hypothetical protein
MAAQKKILVIVLTMVHYRVAVPDLVLISEGLTGLAPLISQVVGHSRPRKVGLGGTQITGVYVRKPARIDRLRQPVTNDLRVVQPVHLGPGGNLPGNWRLRRISKHMLQRPGPIKGMRPWPQVTK